MSKKKKRLQRKAKKTEKRRPPVLKVFGLVIMTVTAFAFYQYMMNTPYFQYVLVGYMILLGALTLLYLVYNRGFAWARYAEGFDKEGSENYDFVKDGQQRKKRSEWMLIFIFPLVFTFGIDFILLTFLDTILSLFKG